jgi:hypothetical protein
VTWISWSHQAQRPHARDLFLMAAEVEDAVGRQVDFLIRADVEAMKSIEARDLIHATAVTLYVFSATESDRRAELLPKSSRASARRVLLKKNYA